MCTWGSIKAASCARVLRRPYKTILAHNLVYMQVSDDIGADSTLEGGELAPLLSIRDAFPEVLIARTRHEPYTREGVLVLDLARWMLGEQGF